ncbi:MAG TPA: FliA/WhiG family RNA polymerase sigma factor [Bryobacteraceae bacterium]|nr:FliA/WhiG family RNA polymerase sigma factor [Bryobacteraceae bacterium]
MNPSTALAYTQAGNHGDSEREQLILDHLPQVRWIATRIHERLPNNTSLEDLISIGIIGLINAIDSFDPSFNVQLKTYAEHRIRGAILDSIRGLDGVAPHKRKRVKQIQVAVGKLEQALQRAPTEEEIAAELRMTLEEYRESLLELRGVTIGSLDAPTRGDDARTLLSYLADREDQTPARLLERSELEKLIEQGIERMPRAERIVLDLYYRQGQNIREIAPILDLHITRISQLKAQAILRLREYIERYWPVSRGV